MKLDDLIRELEFIRSRIGNVEAVLDDYYTKATLNVDNLFIEPRNGEIGKETVVVIRT
jgi:hypothetical protein